MNGVKTNKIVKKDFLKLNEDNVMFITNPGRMGDEDGSTFIVKKGNEFIIYRIDGWMYPSRGEKEEIISMADATEQFPKWYEAWKRYDDKDYEGKYIYLYMGFGNGLCVDKSIYSEFEPYLNNLVREHLKGKEDREDLRYGAIFDVWKKAVVEMAKDKKIVIK